ncbi:hypothetical protein DH2020_039083 [Rehmannia glutinosa]|uniref:Magnesium-protoporphyrin IX monomethyl ester (oxidative) cyclase n=1 Tax=Rehmannia glutinosa TaxID=99300 RepID=A0ABR0UX14_REHGL
MAAEMALLKPISKFTPKFNGNSKISPKPTKFFTVRMSSTATPPSPASAQKKKSSKQEIKESLLTPRFYTTDFDEMEQLFNTEINKNLNMAEFDALLQEFKTDFNQTHFVRNKEFKEAADKLEGPLRQIFVEFLERSCTAEFSGFLLYKELGRRLKVLEQRLIGLQSGPRLGVPNKGQKIHLLQAKVHLLRDLFVREDWILEIHNHIQASQGKPRIPMLPDFQVLENWCQDENRHGDFFSALMKAQPQFLNDWKAKLWSRFFCLSVYVTMYLNDCQRTAFYEGIGLDTKEFDMHVIIETNRTTARIFPAVLDVENPEFKRKLDRMVEINEKILAIGETDDIPLVKNLKRIPLIAALASELLAAYLMKPIESGSVDFAEFEPQLVY